MNIPLDEVIYVEAISSSSTGAAVDADSTPTFAVYEEDTDTAMGGVGGDMTKRTNLIGDYRASFTASAANSFEVGKWYSVIGSATIGGVATKGLLARFRIVAAETTVGTLDVNTKSIDGVSSTNLRKSVNCIGAGTVSTGSTTTSIVTSALTPAGAVADQFKGRIITFDNATTTVGLRGQATDIVTNTSAATPTFTVSALTTAPVSGDIFVIT